jgi:hypothetical protein
MPLFTSQSYGPLIGQSRTIGRRGGRREDETLETVRLVLTRVSDVINTATRRARAGCRVPAEMMRRWCEDIIAAGSGAERVWITELALARHVILPH